MTESALTSEANRAPYGPKSQVSYADPGYQKDHKARYPIDSKSHAVAAWSYIHQARNARLYTGPQLKRIKGRIAKALKHFGVQPSTTEGWVIFPPERLDTPGTTASEYYGGDPQHAGSWSVSASNGPVNLNLSSYGMDPADLDVMLRAAADAACKALKALDPDMDGDIDVPGASAEDTDGDAGGESAPPPGPAAGPDPDPDPTPGAGHPQEPEEPAMGTSPAAAESAPAAADTTAPAGIDPQAFARALVKEQERAARRAAKRDRKAAREAARKAARKPASESAAAGDAPVTETEDQMITRLVAEQLGQAAPATETDEARVQRIVAERVAAAKQEMVATGQVPAVRAGLTADKPVSESGAGGGDGLNEWGLPASWPNKPPHEYTDEEAARYLDPALVRHVLGDKADLLG